MDEPRPRTPPVYDEPPPPPQRYSRRDHYERRRSPSPQPGKREESLDERIERIRRELSESWVNKNDQSTETADYYHPPRPSTPPATYKQHYDAPKPRSRSRSRSRPRSASLPRWDFLSSHYFPSFSLSPSASFQDAILATRTVAFDKPERLSLAWCASACLSRSDLSSFANTDQSKSYVEGTGRPDILFQWRWYHHPLLPLCLDTVLRKISEFELWSFVLFGYPLGFD